MISLKQAIDFVWFAFMEMQGGEIFVKKIPSIKVTDIAKTIVPKAKFRIIGIQPGEKLNEQMISKDENNHTYEYSDYFKILPQTNRHEKNKLFIKNGKKVSKDFIYSSDKNKDWMTRSDLKKWLYKNSDYIGKI
jgi:FlaA1/EpsC-like NDP-sugar epimerase